MFGCLGWIVISFIVTIFLVIGWFWWGMFSHSIDHSDQDLFEDLWKGDISEYPRRESSREQILKEDKD